MSDQPIAKGEGWEVFREPTPEVIVESFRQVVSWLEEHGYTVDALDPTEPVVQDADVREIVAEYSRP